MDKIKKYDARVHVIALIKDEKCLAEKKSNFQVAFRHKQHWW